MSKEGVGDTSDLTQTGWGVVLTLKRRRGRRSKLTGTQIYQSGGIAKIAPLAPAQNV